MVKSDFKYFEDSNGFVMSLTPLPPTKKNVKITPKSKKKIKMTSNFYCDLKIGTGKMSVTRKPIYNVKFSLS